MYYHTEIPTILHYKFAAGVNGMALTAQQKNNNNTSNGERAQPHFVCTFMSNYVLDVRLVVVVLCFFFAVVRKISICAPVTLSSAKKRLKRKTTENR